jgi:hypothetical protein
MNAPATEPIHITIVSYAPGRFVVALAAEAHRAYACGISEIGGWCDCLAVADDTCPHLTMLACTDAGRLVTQ